MKAICIKNERELTEITSKFIFNGEGRLQKFDLTIGKVYDIYELEQLAPKILPIKCIVIDDFRKNIHAPLDFFKPIEQFRDEQIEEILG
jgi:hypothetical protein